MNNLYLAKLCLEELIILKTEPIGPVFVKGPIWQHFRRKYDQLISEYQLPHEIYTYYYNDSFIYNGHDVTSEDVISFMSTRRKFLLVSGEHKCLHISFFLNGISYESIF